MYLCDCTTAVADECAEMMLVKSYSQGVREGGGVHIACFAAAAKVTEAQGAKLTPGVPALGVGKTAGVEENEGVLWQMTRGELLSC